ncbi:MAG: HAMP domain-containing protein [Desulfomonilaceae bacterium]|nr:HAMP domain-containing protein [Desulfomonilaceae bacterium]
MKTSRSIERKMLTYFGLIAAASLLITIEFVWAIRAAVPETTVPALTAETIQSVVLALTSLQNKALLMCVVQATVTLIVLIMFMRRITGPLQQMVESSRIISEGDLRQTIPVRSRDEIGLLGETINGLASNIQEIVALGLTTESSLRAPVADLRQRLPSDSESLRYLSEIEEKLDGFKWLIEDFKLFPAPPPAGNEEGKS